MTITSLRRQPKLRIVDCAIASGTALSSLRDGAELHRLHPPGVNRISLGHRGYLDAPRLFTVRAHYGVPKPRGHRAFLNIAGSAKEK